MRMNKQRLGQYARLFAGLGGFWLLSFVVLPAMTNSCTSFKQLADFVDASGIDTTRFYYTDVEIVTQADIGARSTIEYFSDRRNKEQGD